MSDVSGESVSERLGRIRSQRDDSDKNVRTTTKVINNLTIGANVSRHGRVDRIGPIEYDDAKLRTLRYFLLIRIDATESS